MKRVTETINEREILARAVISTIRDYNNQLYATDIADHLPPYLDQKVRRTIWRLIDENRLRLDSNGQLEVVE